MALRWSEETLETLDTVEETTLDILDGPVMVRRDIRYTKYTGRRYNRYTR